MEQITGNIENKSEEFWSLYENGLPLPPFKYSNGKTQKEIVKEIVQLIRAGKKVIFLKGVCGTGKSVIALNIARCLGKTAIVVPIKNLQKQYEKDYTSKKYLLKNNKKMKIAVITGRDNHDSIIKPGATCADPFLPDTITIAEKNKSKILEYYQSNPFISNKSISNVRRLRRISIAPANPYWSPIMPIEMPLYQLTDAKQKIYRGIHGRKFIFYHRKEGCGYFDQYQSYLDADVLIFNSAKYLIEMAIGRKPETEVDIIDEADEFLDSFSEQATINLTKLKIALSSLPVESDFVSEKIKVLCKIIELEETNKRAIGVNEKEIIPLHKTAIEKILRNMLFNVELQAELALDELNYANRAFEVANEFEDFFDETYITFSFEEKELNVHLITTDLSKRFAELRSRTKALVLMSGTIHSDSVLRYVFGIDDYAVVEAETSLPGKIDIIQTGREFDCSFKNFHSMENSRLIYLNALNSCMEKAIIPLLVQVNAFNDLPSDDEARANVLKNELISREKLRAIQRNDRNGELISKFKSGIDKILFSTKCARGVDFPKEQCNSIIFTKYPNPDASDIFWKLLKKTHAQFYWSFYKDKAKREFLQRLYRALRSSDDHVYLLSPDSRVLDAGRELQEKIGN